MKNKKEMSTFQIFIIRALSEKDETDPSPLEVPLGSIPITGSFTYLVEPEAKSNSGKSAGQVDTCIGTNCGRVGCSDCDTTHDMIPATPDYGIFDTIRTTHWDQTSGVIVVKTSTTTVASASTIADAIEAFEFDAFYLAKWLDRPDQFQTLSNVDGVFKIVRTWNAHGFQAIGFSSAGFGSLSDRFPSSTNPVVCRPFSQVINTLIQNGNIKAITTTPSLMQYDSTRVESVCDSSAAAIAGVPAIHSYLRTAECRGSTVPEKPLNRRVSTDISLFWLCIVAVVVIIAAWVILNVTGKDTLTPIGGRLSRN